MQNQSKLILHHVGGRAGSISFPIPENFEQDIINIIYEADETCVKQIESILEEALLKSPDNPSALTLKGLKELENKNIDLTISLWTKALTLLESEKDKSELKALIEAVKKLKNQ